MSSTASTWVTRCGEGRKDVSSRATTRAVHAMAIAMCQRWTRMESAKSGYGLKLFPSKKKWCSKYSTGTQKDSASMRLRGSYERRESPHPGRHARILSAAGQQMASAGYFETRNILEQTSGVAPLVFATRKRADV